jgi:hypothetical protein
MQIQIPERQRVWNPTMMTPSDQHHPSPSLPWYTWRIHSCLSFVSGISFILYSKEQDFMFFNCLSEICTNNFKND